MQLTIEVPEQDLLTFGRETIEKELQATLTRLRQRHRLGVLAEGLRETYSETEYQQALEQVRADSWQEYKQGLEL